MGAGAGAAVHDGREARAGAEIASISFRSAFRAGEEPEVGDTRGSSGCRASQNFCLKRYNAPLHLTFGATEVAPRRVTFNVTMSAVRTDPRQWRRVLLLFARMEADSVQPDLISYNACISPQITESAREPHHVRDLMRVPQNVRDLMRISPSFRLFRSAFFPKLISPFLPSLCLLKKQ